MKLVIVESPSKAKKIQGYLGSGWQVLASMGHVRDLPPRALGVAVDEDFTPTYEVVRGKGKTIARIRAAAKEAEALYLATDPDREGEAIAWHVLEAIGGAARRKPLFRVTFTEITPHAVRAAFQRPRQLDMALVDSQQARRVLDRLVGWKVSPVLRHAFGTSLSAGRVQSVAVRLVVEREEAIEAFEPEQFWTVEARFARQTPAQEEFLATLAALLDPADKALDPKRLPTERAQRIADELSNEALGWRVLDVATKEQQRRPPPPFITSTLQQKASSVLKMKPRRAMQVAQALYEKGRITYMRTDSPAVARDAQQAARDVIAQLFGAATLPTKPPFYRAKGNAQEAHECIRPTDPRALPKHAGLSGQEASLYRLIWMRFVASQMAPARYDVTVATIEPHKAGRALPYRFSARGRVLREAGWLTVYGVQPGFAGEDDEAGDDQALPPLDGGEPLWLRALWPEEHWTKPPPRYTEPSLIKALEKEGVGRPSTYASIMDTIQQRGYVTVEDKSLLPTEAGRAVTHFLVTQFPDLLDLGFTRQMEDDLDRVAEGRVAWASLMAQFYDPLAARIDAAKRAARDLPPDAALTPPCPACGTPLEEKYGKYGRYQACPACGYRPKGQTEHTDKACPDCGKPLVKRRSKHGPFLGCSGYPLCGYVEALKSRRKGARKTLDKESAAVIGTPCPECGEPMVERSGRYGPFAACSGYPACRFIFRSSQRKARRKRRTAPTEAVEATVALAGAGEPCPKCGKSLVVRQSRYGPFVGCSGYPTCQYIHRP